MEELTPHEAFQEILNKEKILQSWERRLRENFENTKNMSKTVIRNSIPEFLDRISQSIRSKNSKLTVKRAELSGKEHAKQRIDYQSASLSQIITEYYLLRKSVFEVAGDSIRQNFRDLEIVLDSFDVATKEAVEWYSCHIITQERKKDEERIRKLLALIEGSEDLIALTDFEFKIIYLNKNGKRWLGIEQEDLFPESILTDYLHPKSKGFIGASTSLWKGQATWVNKTTNKEIISFTSFFKIIDPTTKEPTAYACIARDIGEFIQNKELLEVTINNLKDEKLIREQFVRGLAHDLRTQLTVAKMTMEFIQRETENMNLEQKNITVINSLNNIEAMIRNILDANKLSSGQKISIETKPIELKGTIQSVVDQIKLIHGARFKIHGDQYIIGEWDEKSISRIIENLLTNAVKYGDTNKEISVHLRDLGEAASVSVHNYGSYIPADKQEDIFKLFTRIDNTNKKEGWGIGLTLVKGLVESHKGTITVTSSEHKGTTFTVTLPKHVFA